MKCAASSGIAGIDGSTTTAAAATRTLLELNDDDSIRHQCADHLKKEFDSRVSQ